jgi:hypothetical protein
MKILTAILLIGAVAFIVMSIKLTADMFREFGSDKSAEERTAAVKRIRNKMIACYVGAVLLITAAAVVKMIAG